MKFIRYEVHKEIKIGIIIEGNWILALEDILPNRQFHTMQDVITTLSEQEMEQLLAVEKEPAKYPMQEADKVKVLAPIERPRHDILCVGVNYRAHLEEATGKVAIKEAPASTVYFSKRATKILGPEDAVKGQFTLDEELDYEVELAVIIGKDGKDIKKEEAEEYIFGYSVFNDLSSRKLQKSHMQWFRGKSLDTYTAMGPVILHKSSLPFPVEAEVISRVNGEERQHSNTRMLMKQIPELIQELSRGMTLEAGDIIVTGTPAGVAMGMNPPKFLKAGDIVECEIPRIGILRNRIEAE